MYDGEGGDESLFCEPQCCTWTGLGYVRLEIEYASLLVQVRVSDLLVDNPAWCVSLRISKLGHLATMRCLCYSLSWRYYIW